MPHCYRHDFILLYWPFFFLPALFFGAKCSTFIMESSPLPSQPVFTSLVENCSATSHGDNSPQMQKRGKTHRWNIYSATKMNRCTETFLCSPSVMWHRGTHFPLPFLIHAISERDVITKGCEGMCLNLPASKHESAGTFRPSYCKNKCAKTLKYLWPVALISLSRLRGWRKTTLWTLSSPTWIHFSLDIRRGWPLMMRNAHSPLYDHCALRRCFVCLLFILYSPTF